MDQNVVPKNFHNDQISQKLWEIVKTTLNYFIVLQLWGEGHEK